MKPRPITTLLVIMAVGACSREQRDRRDQGAAKARETAGAAHA